MLDPKSKRQPDTMWTETFNVIDKKSLNELAKLVNPPEVVKIVTGVFMVLDGKQDLVTYMDKEIKGVHARFPDGWRAFNQGLRQGRLKDVSGFMRLKQMIDDGQMPESNVLEAKQMLTNPLLSVKMVASSSSAAAGLCRFMHVLVEYYEWKLKQHEEDGSSRPRQAPLPVKTSLTTSQALKQRDDKCLDPKILLDESEMIRLMAAQMMASPSQHAAALAAGMVSLAKIVAPTAAPSDLDLLNSKGQSCLLLAASHGIDSLVKAQVEAGAKVELRDQQDRTSLMIAIYHGHIKTAHLLIAPIQGQRS